MRYVGHGFALYLDIKTGVSSWYFKAALSFFFFNVTNLLHDRG